VPFKPSISNKKRSEIVSNIINNVVRFNNIYISISLKRVLILSKVLLRVLSRVVISKRESNLDIFSMN